MKIYKVFVDKAPETCEECDFAKHVYYDSQSVECIAVGESSIIKHCKHKDCPLCEKSTLESEENTIEFKTEKMKGLKL